MHTEGEGIGTAAPRWLHGDLTGAVIRAAQRVHRVLGPGFLEKVYENALVIELRAQGIKAVQQAPIEVRYRGEVVGTYFADLLVEDRLIIEVKAGDAIAEAHESQLINYLRATRIEVGLVLNFGPRLDVKRRIFTNDRKPSD